MPEAAGETFGGEFARRGKQEYRRDAEHVSSASMKQAMPEIRPIVARSQKDVDMVVMP